MIVDPELLGLEPVKEQI